jgi:Leucine-rich repeat (LRR) protein
MAELLLATAELFLDTLCSPAAEQIGLLWGVKDEIESLTNTVSTIKDVLLDAEEKQAAGDRAVRRWLGRLEDAIYDADDLLDAVSTEALRREIMTHDKKAKQVRIFFSKSNQLAYRLKMTRKIKAIRKRLDAINADRKNFQLEVRHVETRVVNRDRDQTHSLVRQEVVIGRENDKKAVIDCLMDSNVEENVSILPIVGIGGLGKTTLAQLVFNDKQIQKHFDLKMWVCVSDIFDVKTIVAKILESATNKEQPTVEMNTLVNYLLKEIDGKKYFLVLDDVWNGDHGKWCRLKEVLMGGARGSRILVTTRNEIVARTIRQESVARIIGTVESYSLKGLAEDTSWSLFKQKAFAKGQEPENSSIVALGKEIVKKCQGVPLAITTIGSLLGSKNSETEWLSFKNNELSKIFQNENDIIPTLKLSYDHLPSHLKHCFAYCSLYPKDYKIDTSNLVKLWIAQGFVKSFDRCLEEVGNEYLKGLLWRSFFQEAVTDEFGDVIGCKMHDLMHDLALSVAGSLIATLDDKKTNVDEKTRHVSLLVGYDRHISSLFEASRIRTLLYLSDDKYEIDCDELFSSFKFLRMLDLSNRNLDSVPSSIRELKHLRYLDLSNNQKMKKLPDSINRLHNLQTLILFSCYSLEELPRDIKKLVNLRHLEINDCHALMYMPHGLGQLNNLQTLTTFVVHLCSHSRHCGDLQELNGLHKSRGWLEIRNLGYGKGVASEYKAANLKDKQHLHSLRLCWSTKGDVNDWDVVEDEMSSEGFRPHPNLKVLELYCYMGLRLPSWVSSLANLITFKLRKCKKCQYLPPLSRLPSLKTLFLEYMDGMQYISDSNDFSSPSSALEPFFSSLENIRLYNCPNLKGWWRRDSSVKLNSESHNSVEITEDTSLTSFPRLSEVRISKCPMLTSMPMFPHLEEDLLLDNTSWKPLQHTIMMNMAVPQSPTSIASSSSSSTPLSKLKRLTLRSIMDLITIPLQHFTSLQVLFLVDCPKLELANDEDEMQWQALTSLFFLYFSGLPKLVSLPSGLQHVTTLQKLQIWNCESLTVVPDWIHNCKSLQIFEISRCSNLSSLPEGMGRLTSLRRLKIEDCPILLRRCKRDTGEDWGKIAHIPELDLR